MRLNYETRQEAEYAAVLWCDALSKTNDCQMLTSGLGCLSIAVSGDAQLFAGGNALFQDAADAAAQDGGRSRIDYRAAGLQQLTALRPKLVGSEA